MREIREQPSLSIKGQMEKNERLKESKAFVSEKVIRISKVLLSN